MAQTDLPQMIVAITFAVVVGVTLLAIMATAVGIAFGVWTDIMHERRIQNEKDNAPTKEGAD